MRHTEAVALAVFALSVLLPVATWAAPGENDGAYDRRIYYSQPMGYSVWKRHPESVEAFARLLEQNRLNATPEQYARSLHDAGWISGADVPTATAFVRSLKVVPVGEDETYRMGRILRSYRTHEGKLDSNFFQSIKAGELGYVDAHGNLVIRVLCLNVVYPARKVSVLPAHEENPVAQSAPGEPVASAVAPEPPPSNPETDFHFNPPPQFPPPAREVEEPVSRSRP